MSSRGYSSKNKFIRAEHEADNDRDGGKKNRGEETTLFTRHYAINMEMDRGYGSNGASPTSSVARSTDSFARDTRA